MYNIIFLKDLHYKNLKETELANTKRIFFLQNNIHILWLYNLSLVLTIFSFICKAGSPE